jgi:hypothetical protein
MNLSKKTIYSSLYIFAGAIAGFAYYYFVGCRGGSCPIQSNPYISTVYGGLLGLIISGIFTKKNTNETSNEEKES